MSSEASLQLRAIYGPIEEELELFYAFLDEEFRVKEPFIFEILQHISKFRGKQLRPALLFLANRLAGGSVSADLIKIGGVLEMIHTATLVHDDLLDDARIRRQVETVHMRWGDRPAILMGDYIYSRAFHLSTQVPGMARILSETTHAICEGELLQIGTRRVPDLAEETYLEIIRKKTAILHAVAGQIGGLFAGLEPDGVERLYDFGMDLGIAFQMIDDCLDYSGREDVVGKSLGTDLHQGKVTLPLIYLRDQASPTEREWLDRVIRGECGPEDEARAYERVRETGVLQEALARAEGFIHSARSRLHEVGGATQRADVIDSLELVLEYVLKRRR